MIICYKFFIGVVFKLVLFLGGYGLSIEFSSRLKLIDFDDNLLQNVVGFGSVDVGYVIVKLIDFWWNCQW